MSRLKQKLPRLRIRTILLLVNLIVILVPLSGIYIFKLYENELVRQTETELIAQGAFISALFRHEANDSVGRVLASPPPPLDETYRPIPAQIDLSHTPLLPRRPDAVPAPHAPDAASLEIAQRIAPVLEEARLTTLAAFSLMDVNGTVLLGPEEGLSLAHLSEVQQAMEGKYTATIRTRISETAPSAIASFSRNTIFRTFIAYPIMEGDRLYGVLLLSRSPRNVMKALYEERSSVFQAAGMVAFTVLLISLLTSRAISQPVKALLQQVHDIAEGKGRTSPIPLPVTREIAELSTQMAEMAEKLQVRSDYIRQFALHLSHEFKTPLTAIQGALELLSEHNAGMSGEQRKRFIGNALEDTRRLKKLVMRMLELARAEAADPRRETTGYSELMEKLAARYRDHGLALHFSPEDIFLPLPADIAETVLVNLLENSLQQGATEVTVTSVVQDGVLMLHIADNGGGISPANAEQLFTLFFTTHRAEGGTGLGLVIIKALLKAHGADISLESSMPDAVFQIRFSSFISQ